MADNPVTCVLDRLDADDVSAVESIFRVPSGRIIVDMRKVAVATPEGVALLARFVRQAKSRSVSVEFVSVAPAARRALVAAGLQHLVSLAE